MDIVSTTAPDQPVADPASSLAETRSAPAGGGPGDGDTAVTLPGVVTLGTERPGRSWYVVPAARPHPSAAA